MSNKKELLTPEDNIQVDTEPFVDEELHESLKQVADIAIELEKEEIRPDFEEVGQGMEISSTTEAIAAKLEATLDNIEDVEDMLKVQAKKLQRRRILMVLIGVLYVVCLVARIIAL